jgi:ABC-type antimicrobial peptide transport system permease subunit
MAGRDFAEQDTHTSERVAIVNVAFAQRYFKDQIQGQNIDPALMLSGRRVIGVVGNVRQSGPQRPIEPVVYIPLAQVSDSLMESIRHFMAMHFYLKMKGRPGLAMPGVRAAVQEIAPDQAVSDLSEFNEVVASITAPQRLDLKLVGILSLLALMVANVGLYSVASVAIASQTRDFGIQAALGAGPRRLVAQILTDVLRQILAGLVLGTAAGFIVSRYLRNTITGLDAVGLGDVLLTCALLALVGVFVCLRPAVRAARVNPFEALKEQ